MTKTDVRKTILKILENDLQIECAENFPDNIELKLLGIDSIALMALMVYLEETLECSLEEIYFDFDEGITLEKLTDAIYAIMDEI